MKPQAPEPSGCHRCQQPAERVVSLAIEEISRWRETHFLEEPYVKGFFSEKGKRPAVLDHLRMQGFHLNTPKCFFLSLSVIGFLPC